MKIPIITPRPVRKPSALKKVLYGWKTISYDYLAWWNNVGPLGAPEWPLTALGQHPTIWTNDTAPWSPVARHAQRIHDGEVALEWRRYPTGFRLVFVGRERDGP